MIFLDCSILQANPNRAVFLLHAWPDLVKSLQALVGALLDKKGGNARAVRKAMEKLCLSMAAFIDPTGTSGPREGGASEEAINQQKHAQLFSSLKRLQTA